ncbi:MAG: hypothetical protein IJ808_00565, partial [Muribaculaceae bacterium]|nr:hypothetical protein [Muribaculaceae bacterium]
KTILSLILSVLVALMAGAQPPVNWHWQACMLSAIDQFPDRGGYYTGSHPNALFAKTTLQGLHEAFVMTREDSVPQFLPHRAQPSFCSSATYGVLVKALLTWDTAHVISRDAWRNMKPCVGIADELNAQGMGQDDGVGFWGRANANGPGLGVLVAELDAGVSLTAYRGARNDTVKETPTERYLTDEEWNAHPIWWQAVPGDLMKIFWNRNDTRGHDGGAIIGYDGVKGHLQEAGHSVVFLGIDDEGRVMYWSSNGPGEHPETMGYSRSSCAKTAIQRVVFTRILRPDRFDRVRHMPPTHVNTYLYELNGHKHSNTTEMLRHLTPGTTIVTKEERP